MRILANDSSSDVSYDVSLLPVNRIILKTIKLSGIWWFVIVDANYHLMDHNPNASSVCGAWIGGICYLVEK